MSTPVVWTENEYDDLGLADYGVQGVGYSAFNVTRVHYITASVAWLSNIIRENVAVMNAVQDRALSNPSYSLVEILPSTLPVRVTHMCVVLIPTARGGNGRLVFVMFLPTAVATRFFSRTHAGTYVR